jgi:hypothetical protein
MTVDNFDRDGPSRSLTTVDGGTFETQVRFESHSSPSRSVVQALEAATGVDALELPPLHGAIDTEALDAIIESTGPAASISFDYGGLRVTVLGDGEITITDREEL